MGNHIAAYSFKLNQSTKMTAVFSLKKINIILKLSCCTLLALTSLHAEESTQEKTQAAKSVVQTTQSKTEKTRPSLERLASDTVNGDFDNLTAKSVTQTSTLAGALISAYQNNNSIEAKRREVLASHAKITDARAGFFPTIDLQGSLSGNRTKYDADARPTSGAYKTDSQLSHSLSGQITLKQNLFAGGSTLAAITSAEKGIRSNWAALMSNEQQLFSQVIDAYLTLIMKEATVDARKAYRDSMQKNYETSFERQKIGEETVTQVAIAEAQLMKADAELRTAEAEVVAAKATYQQITLSAPSKLVTPDLPTGLPTTLQKAIDLASDNNPQLLQARYTHESAVASIDQANAQLFSPSVNVEASASRQANNQRTVGIQEKATVGSRAWTRQNAGSVSLNVTYPLYAGGRYSSQRRAAHDTALSKRFEIENTKTQLEAQIKSTFESLNAAKSNIENYNKQVKAGELSVSAIKQELEVGTKVLKDVLDQESNLLNAKIGLLQAENLHLKTAYKLVELLGGLHAKALKLDVPYFDPKAHYDNVPIGF